VSLADQNGRGDSQTRRGRCLCRRYWLWKNSYLLAALALPTYQHPIGRQPTNLQIPFHGGLLDVHGSCWSMAHPYDRDLFNYFRLAELFFELAEILWANEDNIFSEFLGVESFTTGEI
jgi:hypothetical protein